VGRVRCCVVTWSPEESRNYLGQRGSSACSSHALLAMGDVACDALRRSDLGTCVIVESYYEQTHPRGTETMSDEDWNNPKPSASAPPDWLFSEGHEPDENYTRPTDCKTHAFEIFQTRDGAWGVLLADYIPESNDVASAVFFSTKEEALAFVATHAPKSG
jgi:hypothetical protein